jgi:hypothetical protein
MRIRILLRPSLLLFGMLPLPLVHAQFEPPTQEELHFASDAHAPGAAAIYLCREETTDDTLHFHSYYERIKVLAEKGKELATVRIPYDYAAYKVTEIEGRTIHSDGTVVPMTTVPSDLMDYKEKGVQVNNLVFNLPSVEVGSILEYRLKLSYSEKMVSSPSWEIQQPYFVREAHYVFHPNILFGTVIEGKHGETLSNRLYTERLGAGQHVVENKRGTTYSLDLTDIPPLPQEESMPPLNTLRWQVEFYYSASSTSAQYWASSGRTWADDVNRFANPSGLLNKVVAGMVGADDSEAVKAAKIYAEVQKLENTSFTREKSESERKAEKIHKVITAEDVWGQQGGSPDDLARLYVALARAAGMKAWPMQVVDRDRAMFTMRYLSMDQLDDYIAIVEIGGKEVFVDPGQPMCPFGSLHWKHALASGLRLTPKGPQTATTSAISFKSAVVQRTADLSLDQQGNLKGTIRLILSGPEALYYRQLAIGNDPEEVKNQVKESLSESIPEGLLVNFDHFIGLDNSSTSLVAVLQVNGSVGAPTGKRLFLPGTFFESRGTQPFVTEAKRVTPVDLHFPRTVQDEVTYHLPSGLNVESAPQNTDLGWPEHALLRIGSTQEDNSVTITRTLAYNFTLVEDRDYQSLHDFYLKAASADQQPLVLTRVVVPKDNRSG